MVYHITYKICSDLDCDNHCLKDNVFCYFHCNIEKSEKVKQKTIYELIKYPEHDSGVNIIKDFVYTKSWLFYKKWITDNIYEYTYKIN